MQFHGKMDTLIISYCIPETNTFDFRVKLLTRTKHLQGIRLAKNFTKGHEKVFKMCKFNSP